MVISTVAKEDPVQSNRAQDPSALCVHPVPLDGTDVLATENTHPVRTSNRTLYIKPSPLGRVNACYRLTRVLSLPPLVSSEFDRAACQTAHRRGDHRQLRGRLQCAGPGAPEGGPVLYSHPLTHTPAPSGRGPFAYLRTTTATARSPSCPLRTPSLRGTLSRRIRPSHAGESAGPEGESDSGG